MGLAEMAAAPVEQPDETAPPALDTPSEAQPVVDTTPVADEPAPAKRGK